MRSRSGAPDRRPARLRGAGRPHDHRRIVGTDTGSYRTGMGWLQADNYWLARLVVQRGVAAVYVLAFASAVLQLPALLGEHGLLPIPHFVARMPFRRAPSLFHFAFSDRLAAGICLLGAVLAAALVAGLPQAGPAWTSMAVWLAMWLLYLSVVNVGQIFYAFGWESLLLEAGFLAAFLGSSSVAPPATVLWLFRWLAFRLEFGAGLIKLRGDDCWRDLTCLYYHHETQPLPGPLSWYFHRLPKSLHRVEVAANHFAQVVAPFGLFAPQPAASVAAGVIIVTQGWLVLSGNFAWLNVLTMLVAFAALDDTTLRGFHHPPVGAFPEWYMVIVLAVTALALALSYQPARNLVSRRQLMNAHFNPLHLINAYGAFGSITRQRYEVVVEGTDSPVPDESASWLEYEFKGKPGDPRRRAPQVAPYHLRLDWLMWFAAMSSPSAHPWFAALLKRILAGDRRTLRLMRTNPFPDAPPRFVRARLYRYRFTDFAERRRTGAWWTRRLVGDYARPVSLPDSRPGRANAFRPG